MSDLVICSSAQPKMLDDTGQCHQSSSRMTDTRGKARVHVSGARGDQASNVNWPRDYWAPEASRQLRHVTNDGTQPSNDNPEINWQKIQYELEYNQNIS